MNRDVITIGASAGGLEVLLEMVGDLPCDLPASIFVVVHTPAYHTSLLPELLSSRGKLPARHPLHQEPIVPGTIYVAPPDNHLMLRPGSMDVVRSAKENGHRPAANALFRTASLAYGPRVIGVVLSGYLDCGTAGTMSIKARGGLSVVQSPGTAHAPDMPQSVIDHVEVDHVVRPAELAALLTRLVQTPAIVPIAANKPDTTIDELEGHRLGKPTAIVCPLCDGVLTEAKAGRYEQYACHVGHTFSLASLVEEQGVQMERSLWGAVRALEESAGLSRKLAAREKGELRARFAEKAATQQAEADVIRNVLLRGSTLSSEDAGSLR